MFAMKDISDIYQRRVVPSNIPSTLFFGASIMFTYIAIGVVLCVVLALVSALTSHNEFDNLTH